MPDPLATISTRITPQSERADARQIPNAAGGYAFQISDETRIHRFLTLGTTGGTYYTSEQALTKANADVLLAAARDRGEWLVEQLTAVSVAGRAPRQNPAIFALAAVAGLGDDAGRRAAFDAIPKVCRTGTHLFLFAGYVEQFRGWGRGLRRAVSRWYFGTTPDELAYQVVKYRHRNTWTHRDLLRLAHVGLDDGITPEPARAGLFNWLTKTDVDLSTVPALVRAFEAAQKTDKVADWLELIGNYPLSWEMLPDAALTQPMVWRALIRKGMPQTALIRQLPRLTRLGVFEDADAGRFTGTAGRDALNIVVAQLQDQDRLRKARVHPINVLVAQRTYASGRSAAGSGEWTPKRQIVDALDAAFYAAFGAVQAAGKRTLLALDVSGSMGSPASGLPISCREASAALALVTMATEPDTDVVGFTADGNGDWRFQQGTAISTLAISPRQRLDDAIRAVSGLPFGGTDCSLPMTWALEQGRSYDTFVVLTDNETWAGSIHPHQALVQYREKTGIDARLVVVGMTASDVSVSDPLDPGSLDIAGFDSAVPNLIADFSRGDI